MNAKLSPGYEDVAARLAEMEQIVKALRNEEVDAVVGSRRFLLVRLQDAVREATHDFFECARNRHVLEAMMENVPDAIVLTGGPPDFQIARISRYGLEMTGKTLTDMSGLAAGQHQEAWGFFLPDGKSRPKAEEMPLYRAAHFGETVSNTELVMQTADGRKLDVIINAAPIRDDEGNVIAAVASYRDVTALKQAERERERLLLDLQMRTAEREAVVESMLVGVAVSDAQGRLVTMNQTGREMIGYDDGAEYFERLSASGRILTPEGSPLGLEQSPLARALRGETVRNLNVHPRQRRFVALDCG